MSITDRATLGIDTDPFCQHRFLSFGDESIVKLWDLRNLQSPIFMNHVDSLKNNVIEEARFSCLHSGVLGILGRDDDYITLWQLQETERHECSVTSELNNRMILRKAQRSKITSYFINIFRFYNFEIYIE